MTDIPKGFQIEQTPVPPGFQIEQQQLSTPTGPAIPQPGGQMREGELTQELPGSGQERAFLDIAGKLKDAASSIESFINRAPVTDPSGKPMAEVGSPEFAEAAGLSTTDQIGIAASFIAEPDPRKRREILERNVPNAVVTMDGENLIVQMMGSGKQFILNQPGPSVQDTAEVMTVIGEILTLGRLGAGRTITGTAGRTGAATAGIVTGEQIGSNVARGQAPFDIDPATTAAAGGFGALFGGAGALAFKLLRGMALKNTFVKKDGTITARGRTVITDAGFNPDSMTPATARQLDKLLRGADDPAAAIREAQARGLNIELTLGQRTQKGGQLGLEDLAAKTPEASTSAARLSQFKTATQPAQLQKSATTEGKRLFGKLSTTVGENFQKTRDRIIARKLKFKDVENKAWEAARRGEASVKPDTIKTLVTKLETIKKDFPEVKAQEVMSAIRSLSPKPSKPVSPTFPRPGSTGGKPIPKPKSVPVSVSEIERVRRIINNMARGPSKAEPIGALQGRFQAAYDDALKKLGRADFVKGDKPQISAFFRARSISRQFREMFKDNPTLVKIIDQRNGKLVLTPEEAVNSLLGAGTGKAGTTATVRNMKAILGAESREFASLKAEVFVRLFRDGARNMLTTGQVRGAKLASNVDDLITNRPTLAGELFSKTELSAIQTFRRVVADAQAKGASNFSNTAVMGRLLNSFAPAMLREIGSRIPGIKSLAGTKASAAARKAFEGLPQKRLTGVGGAPALDDNNLRPILDVLR